MKEQGRVEGQQSLEDLGIRNVNTVWWNLNTPALYEHALQRHEALLAQQGPLVVRTGQYTGRSPKDKYIVREPSSEGNIWWSDDVNPAFDESRYEWSPRVRGTSCSPATCSGASAIRPSSPATCQSFT